MKKRILVLLLCGTMSLFSLTACSGGDSDDSSSSEETAASAETSADTESAEEAGAGTTEETEASAETTETAAAEETVAAADTTEDETEETASASDTADTDSDEELCSDADYEALMKMCANVQEQYDLVNEYYKANFEQNDDMDATLADIKELVDTVMSVDKSQMTASAALDFAQYLNDDAALLDDMAKALVEDRTGVSQ